MNEPRVSAAFSLTTECLPAIRARSGKLKIVRHCLKTAHCRARSSANKISAPFPSIEQIDIIRPFCRDKEKTAYCVGSGRLKIQF